MTCKTGENNTGVLAAELQFFRFLPFPMHATTCPMNFPDLLKIIEVVSVNWGFAWPAFLKSLLRSVRVPFRSRGCARTAAPCE